MSATTQSAQQHDPSVLTLENLKKVLYRYRDEISGKVDMRFHTGGFVRPPPGSFAGVPIMQSPNAVMNYRPVTWVKLPKPTPNRSKRLQKKLTKRTARSGFTGDPAVFQTPDCLFVHPDLYPKLRERLAQGLNR
jgi:hypothetical protein